MACAVLGDPSIAVVKSKNDVMKKLHGWGSLLWCNNELKKYENVKQRSIRLVFVSFSEPKGEKLLMRKVKSMEIDESIMDMISLLDKKNT
ncbi:Structural maintenance of chromosomes protein [Trichinella spiralis]|uniref:Structural maintenance of chromosomes protein n=1 Tax=Trichinella spiralis TaxID=6334 RepID=A0ABR3KME2_TRISP